MCDWFTQEVLCVLISQAVHIAHWIGTTQQRLCFSNLNSHQHFFRCNFFPSSESILTHLTV